MTVTNNTTSINADNNTKIDDLSILSSDATSVTDVEANMDDIMLLLQKVYQKMRNMLQNQNEKQANNSFNMAMSAIEKRKSAAAETYKGSQTAAITQIVTGGASAITGVVGATGMVSKLHNKMKGSNAAEHSTFLSEDKAVELNKKLDEIELNMPEVKFVTPNDAPLRYHERFISNSQEVTSSVSELRGALAKAFENNKTKLSGNELKDLRDRYKAAAKQIDSIESSLMGVAPKVSSEKGAMFGSVASQAINGVGNAAATVVNSKATYNASQEQTKSDYISQSQNVYDKQSDKDAANMKDYSHKLTETTRALTDLHSQMANAVIWK